MKRRSVIVVFMVFCLAVSIMAFANTPAINKVNTPGIFALDAQMASTARPAAPRRAKND